MHYTQMTYDRYVKYGMIPGTYCYEIMSVKFTDGEFGQLIICLNGENVNEINSYDMLPLVIVLNPVKYKLRCRQGIPNNFYNCTINDMKCIVFLANGIIFVVDDKWCDISKIRTTGDIGVVV